MKRWLFNIASILSLLLLVAAAGLWVRSEWYIDNLTWGTASNDYEVFSCSGGIYFGSISGGWWGGKPCPIQYRPARSDRWDQYGDESDYLLEKGSPLVPAFKIGSLRNDGIFPCWVVIIPYWVVVLASSVLPFIHSVTWIVRRRRSRRGGFPVEPNEPKGEP